MLKLSEFVELYGELDWLWLSQKRYTTNPESYSAATQWNESLLYIPAIQEYFVVSSHCGIGEGCFWTDEEVYPINGIASWNSLGKGCPMYED